MGAMFIDTIFPVPTESFKTSFHSNKTAFACALLALLLLQGCESLPRLPGLSGEPDEQEPEAPATTRETAPSTSSAKPPQMIIESCNPEQALAPAREQTKPAEPTKPAKPSKPTKPTKPAMVNNLVVLGAIEYVTIEPLGIRFKARIDTGATGSALDARNITRFERDGEAWVRFTIVDRSTKAEQEYSRKMVRQTPIKGKGVEIELRPVVQFRVIIGDIDQQIEFSLTNRSNLKYPVLIGRNLLRDTAIVDVSRRYTAPKNN
jgi:hypothetical protein